MRYLLLVLPLMMSCATAGQEGSALNDLAEGWDDACTIGKISQAHADYINSTCFGEPDEPCEKGVNEGYCENRPPGQCVRKGDRLTSRDCANFFRSLRGLPPTD